jgi:hypothetical protein
MRGGDPEKETVTNKVRYIEDRLKAEKFVSMFDDDMQ